MTLRHLQIFKTVCEKMSVTAAAEALGMTQPAVSIAVRELEGFYGVRLFDRIGRKIYLTEPGRRLQADAEAILSRWNRSAAGRGNPRAASARTRRSRSASLRRCFRRCRPRSRRRRFPFSSAIPERSSRSSRKTRSTSRCSTRSARPRTARRSRCAATRWPSSARRISPAPTG